MNYEESSIIPPAPSYKCVLIDLFLVIFVANQYFIKTFQNQTAQQTHTKEGGNITYVMLCYVMLCFNKTYLSFTLSLYSAYKRHKREVWCYFIYKHILSCDTFFYIVYGSTYAIYSK